MNVNNDKILFDRYYCINSTKPFKMKKILADFIFIASSHFLTRARFHSEILQA